MNDPNWPELIPLGARQFKARGEANGLQYLLFQYHRVPFEKQNE